MEDPFQDMPDGDSNQCDGTLTGKIQAGKQGRALEIHMAADDGAGTRYHRVLLRRCDRGWGNGGMRELKFISRDAASLLM